MNKERAEADVVASVGDQLRRRIPSAAEEQVVLDRVWTEVRQQPEHGGRLHGLRRAAADTVVPTGRWRAMQMAAAAVFVVAAAIGTAIVWQPADDALFRVVDGDVRVGETIRAGGGAGAVLALLDGSRIEMRSHTELSFERTSDGVRVRLTSGGIIVNAAKQRSGHLYVQTKDMTVSVVGTVFMVNADDEGSRVAVIEGQVRVQQGVTDKNLLPGDQVATSPAMAPATITEEITWSRHAEQHRALLQQSAVTPPTVQASAVSAETRAAFETTSVRLAAPGSIGARGGGASAPSGPSCAGTDLQVDPGRFAVRNIPLYGLITLAYAKECQAQVQHVGGSAWVRLEGYDVQASIPAGSPVYTARQLRDGMAPRLALMLQTMLSDRFRLVLGREMREMAVYNLVVATPGKLKPSVDQNPQERVIVPGAVPVFKPLVGVVGPSVALSSAPMSKIIGLLQSLADRPVIDRTGLAGLFDFVVDWPALAGMSGPDLEFDMRDQLSSRLQERVGLKLEPARTLVEVLVIERAERPSEN
jgi:uncharacterized protein (TIGR03435 family)